MESIFKNVFINDNCSNSLIRKVTLNFQDKNATPEEIKKFQDEIKPKDNAILNQKREVLYEVALPFADKNEIEYSKGFGGRIMMKFKKKLNMIQRDLQTKIKRNDCFKKRFDD